MSLETSTNQGSVVVWEDGALLFSENFEQPRGRGEVLLQVLERAVERFGSVDRIVVGTGPGYYNGIRAAIAVAKGLKMVWKVPVCGISSILGVPSSAEEYVVVGDARGGALFFGRVLGENLEELCLLPRKEFEHRLKAWQGVAYTAISLPEFPHLLIQAPTAAKLASLATKRSDDDASLTPLYLKPPYIHPSTKKFSGVFNSWLPVFSITFAFLFVLAGPVLGENTPTTLMESTGLVEDLQPTWETQKHVRVYEFLIPGPRGQIVDRHGNPLAQVRLSYNLAISFPTPLEWSDVKILAFAKQQIALASALLKREIYISDANILRHYRNRGIIPLDIVEDLKPTELNIVNQGLPSGLVLRQTYARVYPLGSLAGSVIGYTGREAPLSSRMVENGDLIFPESEGREGLEQTFDFQLRGVPGKLNVTYDKNGMKTSERVTVPPVPGYNVVTTLDTNLQKICEEVLKQNVKKGALVIIEPSTGEILALASWPTYDPNIFVPVLNKVIYESLSKDPNTPLLPRAFRAAYPPGSAFKPVVGLAALLNKVITLQTRYPGPASLEIGNMVFHNWKKYDVGLLTFSEALTQSCNTWFYQVGIKTGADPIITLAKQLGLGSRTGLPLRAEESGNIPTDAYMLRRHQRPLLPGDIANLSIGQGDLLVTPLQMAQLMTILANGGQFRQLRLVKQIQTPDNQVVSAYPDRIRANIVIPPDFYQALKSALVGVTEGSTGTAHQARVASVKVAGKTGTAQWGPKHKERTVAWFAGFLPANDPQYAFAVMSEGEPGVEDVHGSSHAAPLIGKVFRSVFQDMEKQKKISSLH